MLEAVDISKEFPGVKALTRVNLKFYPGKVNAILGENGAGKSTLLKILTGVYTQYEGEIRLKNETLKFRNVKEAQQAGIAIIHQELNLIPELSVAENLFLGREILTSLGFLDTPKMHTKARELLDKLQLNAQPETPVKQLKVGEQQLIEIAKALLVNAEIIMMDEPTSAVTDKEIDNLHRIIHELKAEGKTIVYISHKMNELFRIADHYTVMRDGKSVSAGAMSDTSEQQLVQQMVGREVLIAKKEAGLYSEETVLEIKKLNRRHPSVKHRKVLTDISLSLRKGEILGIFGLMGAGRTELLETIFGMHPATSDGEIEINGQKKSLKTPKEAIQHGLAFLTEDRKNEGLVLGMDITSNISLNASPGKDFINQTREKTLARDYIQQLGIKTPSENQYCKNLSGGNQQKVILSKWLAIHPKILMLDEPTRGIDINAKNEIYELIKKLATDHMSVILVSSEIPEILTLADRILVMAEGQIKAGFTAAEATEDKLLKAALPD